MYIQPCCIEKELPELMRKQPFSFFQSNGDWTVQDLMKSVGQLVPHAVCLLALPEADVFLLRTLRTYLSKGWLRALVLVTAEPQGELVKAELQSYLPLVTYANHNQVQDGLLALTDFGKFLVVQGAMLTEKDFTLCQYTGYFGTSGEVFASAVEAVCARAKMGAFIKSPHEDIQSLLDKEYIRK